MARSMFWIDTLFNQDVVSGGNVSQSLMAPHAESTLRLTQLTLTRTIIGIDIAVTVHDSGEGSQGVSLGIGVASQEAVDLGVTALSDPSIATEFPVKGWVWRAHYRVFGFAADQPAAYQQRAVADVKGQRVLGNGEMYIHVVNKPVEGVATTVRVIGFVRQLWKAA